MGPIQSVINLYATTKREWKRMTLCIRGEGPTPCDSGPQGRARVWPSPRALPGEATALGLPRSPTRIQRAGKNCALYRAFAAAALPAVFALLAGCTSNLEADRIQDAAALVQNQRYRLMVHCEDPALDPFVYEDARREFGVLLPLAEADPATGTLEVTFTSSTGSGGLGAGVGYGHASGDPWFTGGSSHGVGLSVGGGGSLTWENSLMMVVLKGADGARLWSARYQHRGNVGFGGGDGSRAVQASRTCLRALAEELRKGLAAPAEKR